MYIVVSSNLVIASYSFIHQKVMKLRNIGHCMKEMKDKVKKRNISWREVIFQLHNFDISRDFDLFRARHLNMSVNRCAYNVLKTYCSTASMRYMRNMFRKTQFSEKEVVEWFLFMKKIGDFPGCRV